MPRRTHDHLLKMRQRIERMEKLLNDLVAYTRAGRVRYREEQVNGVMLVEDVVSLLDAPPGFTISVSEPMPMMVTERVPLETTLRNLVGNAIKHHHHPSRGHVMISARELGEWVEFTVSDNGPGIAPEYQERIFGVFQTLRPRDEVEGSGMGLAIAKRLVEGRGGHIGVHSRLGEGCTFTFTWPKQSLSPKLEPQL
jgi:signal transduction histidine kinase